MAEGAKGRVEAIELSAGEQAAGRRMAESRATIPDFVVEREVAAENPSLGLLVSALGQALREHPRANASYRDGGIESYSRVNVGVGELSGAGSLVPTIFDADRKDAAAVDAELSALAQRAAAGELGPPELSGATATLHDLRSAGLTRFAPIIAPPHAVALGVAVREGRLVLALTCDRRALVPAAAADVLAAVARGI